MKKATNKTQTLRTVLVYVKRNWGYLALSLLLCIVTVAFTLYIPILTGQVIDLIPAAMQVQFDGILPLLIQIGLMIVFTALAQWLMCLCNNRLTYATVRDIRRDAFRHLQHLPLSYLDRHPTGDVVSRIITDVDQFADGLLMGFTQLFSGVLTIIGTLGFMYSVNWIIATAVVVITPLSLVVASFIAKRT